LSYGNEPHEPMKPCDAVCVRRNNKSVMGALFTFSHFEGKVFYQSSFNNFRFLFGIIKFNNDLTEGASALLSTLKSTVGLS